MTFIFKYGVLMLQEKPIRDVLQRWRRSLASLLFFIILLTENFGLSSSIVDHSLQIPNAIPNTTARILRDYWGITNFPVFSRTPLDQCLVMNRNLSKRMCAMKPKLRQQEIRNSHLSFCSFYNVYNIIEFMDSSKGNDSSKKCITGTAHSCQNCLEEIENLDNALYAIFSAFREVLSRYDCEHQFSAHFNCTDCEVGIVSMSKEKIHSNQGVYQEYVGQATTRCEKTEICVCKKLQNHFENCCIPGPLAFFLPWIHPIGYLYHTTCTLALGISSIENLGVVACQHEQCSCLHVSTVSYTD
jgi:hypothetical protein